MATWIRSVSVKTGMNKSILSATTEEFRAIETMGLLSVIAVWEIQQRSGTSESDESGLLVSQAWSIA